ncbi:MAG: CPBP family intramembrane glutamic endopeptidase, partial [Pseudomonadota bacterium]
VFAGVAWQTWVLLGTASVVLVLFRALGTVAAYNRAFGSLWPGHPWRPALPNLYWFACSLLGLFAIPWLVGRLGLRLNRAELGLGLGEWRLGGKLAVLAYAVMLPFVVGAAMTETFVQHYPLSSFVATQAVSWWRDGSGLLGVVLAHEAGYALYFVGWEFFFRGFLTVALARYIGPVAILVQTLPFALLHVGKPLPEALGSIVAGVALGALALRTRSCWWGVLLHIAVALTMDVLAIAARIWVG